MKTYFYLLLTTLTFVLITKTEAQYVKKGITVAGHNDCSPGSDSTSLYFPIGVCVDSKGNIYVSDDQHNRIQKWAPGATYGITVAGQKNGKAGKDSAHLAGPKGITIDASGNIYIADSRNARVQKWAPGAKYGITVAGVKDSLSGLDSFHLFTPNGVFVDASDNVYVSDLRTSHVSKWAAGAKYGVTVAGAKDGSYGSDSAHFNGDYGVCLDATGNIYVAEYFNNRVQKWAPGAKFGVTVAGQKSGSLGKDAAHLTNAVDVKVDALGIVYVADLGNNRVQKWAPGAKYGTTIAGDTMAGCDSSHFRSPVGIWLDASANLYVVTVSNNRVMKFRKYSNSTTEINANGFLLNIFPTPPPASLP